MELKELWKIISPGSLVSVLTANSRSIYQGRAEKGIVPAEIAKEGNREVELEYMVTYASTKSTADVKKGPKTENRKEEVIVETTATIESKLTIILKSDADELLRKAVKI